MAQTLFKPKDYPVRTAMEVKRRHGRVINPPRIPEIGGSTKNNMDQRESELSLKKPGDTI